MNKRTLLAILLPIALSGCPWGGGGGGGGDSPPVATDEPPYTPGEPGPPDYSRVMAMIVDDGFTQSADVLYVLHADPTVAGKNTGVHGDASISEFRKRSDVGIIGYVPWDSSVVPNPAWPLACFIPEMPNCSNAKVDLDAPVYWAADNNVRIVYIRWGGCCFDATHQAAARYAWERGTVVVWPAAQGGVNLPFASPYMFVVTTRWNREGDIWRIANQGAAVDRKIGAQGTSHPAVAAAGLMAEVAEDIHPSLDSAGSRAIVDEFLRRYPNP